MENYIRKLQGKSLSNQEILTLVKNKANLVSYTDLHKYNSLDQLLGQYGACIILYETKKNYGHWCCIFKFPDGKTIEFFDPYGLFPDKERQFISKAFRKESNQNYPYLTALMLKSPYILTYNHFPFQEIKTGVNSCGRWCAIRLIFRNLTLKDFIKIFGKNRKYTNDFYATLITGNI